MAGSPPVPRLQPPTPHWQCADARPSRLTPIDSHGDVGAIGGPTHEDTLSVQLRQIEDHLIARLLLGRHSTRGKSNDGPVAE